MVWNLTAALMQTQSKTSLHLAGWASPDHLVTNGIKASKFPFALFVFAGVTCWSGNRCLVTRATQLICPTHLPRHRIGDV